MSACHAGGPGFEFRHSPQHFKPRMKARHNEQGSLSDSVIMRQSRQKGVLHSDRKASTGLIEAARLAGRTAANMAMTNRAETDMPIEAGSALLV